MPKIKDSNYKHFLQTGQIDLIDKDNFALMLEKVKHKHQEQARALFIMLYWSGRRPSEILELTPELIKKETRFVKIMFPTKKGGRFSTLLFPLQNPHIKEFWNYSNSAGFPGFKIFWAFRGKLGGGYYKKRVKWVTQNGEIRVKEYNGESKRLRYWVLKWCGITPYFFRHNRFSTMADMGADLDDIMHAKGSKTYASIMPYKHLSTKRAKRISKFYK